MKDKLVDTALLKRISPLLANPILAKAVMMIGGINKVNRIYDSAKYAQGIDTTAALLQAMGITPVVHGAEALAPLDGQPFITVSNHPYGHIDGIILIDTLARLHPDFRVMVNWILHQIDILDQYFIGVNPYTDGQFSNSSVGGVRACLEHLEQGHPLGLFPAGSVSKNIGHGASADRPWLTGVIKLIRTADVPVVPVYISGQNSPLFNFLDYFPWWVRNIRLCHEMANKHGSEIHLVVGQPILPDAIRSYTDTDLLRTYLQTETYRQGGRLTDDGKLQGKLSDKQRSYYGI
jgi:putative hemolysin